MSLEKLAELSRGYGADEEYVLAGGGNTSWKDGTLLYIKASGYSLASITPGGFAMMDRNKLDAVWKKKYPDNTDIREAEALADLMAARAAGESKRPSVETLLHELFPQAFVVHMHPALVNGLTCSGDGEKRAAELFGASSGIRGGALWIPTVNPGYVLAKTIKDITDAHMSRGNEFPSVLFLQNHGVFVAGETPEDIERTYIFIFDILKKLIARRPDLGETENRTPEFVRRSTRFEHMLKEELKKDFCAFLSNRELSAFSASRESMAPLSSAYTPDHIVYSGHAPLYVPLKEDESAQRKSLQEGLADFLKAWGVLPKTVVLQNTGAFFCMDSRKAADTASLVFKDALKVAVYAESFGGCSFMPEEQIRFILTWEVEQYRAEVSTK